MNKTISKSLFRKAFRVIQCPRVWLYQTQESVVVLATALPTTQQRTLRRFAKPPISRDKKLKQMSLNRFTTSSTPLQPNKRTQSQRTITLWTSPSANSNWKLWMSWLILLARSSLSEKFRTLNPGKSLTWKPNHQFLRSSSNTRSSSASPRSPLVPSRPLWDTPNWTSRPRSGQISPRCNNLKFKPQAQVLIYNYNKTSNFTLYLTKSNKTLMWNNLDPSSLACSSSWWVHCQETTTTTTATCFLRHYYCSKTVPTLTNFPHLSLQWWDRVTVRGTFFLSYSTLLNNHLSNNSNTSSSCPYSRDPRSKSQWSSRGHPSPRMEHSRVGSIRLWHKQKTKNHPATKILDCPRKNQEAKKAKLTIKNMSPMLIISITVSLSSKVEKAVNQPTRVEIARAAQRSAPALLLIQPINKTKMFHNWRILHLNQ